MPTVSKLDCCQPAPISGFTTATGHTLTLTEKDLSDVMENIFNTSDMESTAFSPADNWGTELSSSESILQQQSILPLPVETPEDGNSAQSEENTGSNNSSEETKGRRRFRLTQKQTDHLNMVFKNQKSISEEERKSLAERLQLTSRQVKKWFENKRFKDKIMKANENEDQHATPSIPDAHTRINGDFSMNQPLRPTPFGDHCAIGTYCASGSMNSDCHNFGYPQQGLRHTSQFDLYSTNTTYNTQGSFPINSQLPVDQSRLNQNPFDPTFNTTSPFNTHGSVHHYGHYSPYGQGQGQWNPYDPYMQSTPAHGTYGYDPVSNGTIQPPNCISTNGDPNFGYDVMPNANPVMNCDYHQNQGNFDYGNSQVYNQPYYPDNLVNSSDVSLLPLQKTRPQARITKSSTKEEKEKINKQRMILEKKFRETPSLSRRENKNLAMETGLTPRQITQWFCYRRRALKKKHDHQEDTLVEDSAK